MTEVTTIQLDGLSPSFRSNQHIVGDGLDGGGDCQEESEGNMGCARI
jgi:hypothetical protein